VANVAWDALQTLTSSMKFWRMNELTSGTAVPPIDLGADWSAAVAHVRAELGLRHARCLDQVEKRQLAARDQGHRATQRC